MLRCPHCGEERKERIFHRNGWIVCLTCSFKQWLVKNGIIQGPIDWLIQTEKAEVFVDVETEEATEVDREPVYSTDKRSVLPVYTE